MFYSTNRTFMELKFYHTVCIRIERMYQSNLYGIEMSNFQQYVKVVQRTNRTFMELKCRWVDSMGWRLRVPIEPLWNWNAVELSAERLQIVVPIEPLWNWNEPPAVGAAWILTVPIEPLWNWNDYRRSRGHRQINVPIEPLWNWNWHVSTLPPP